MPNILTFQEALDASKGEDRALLIGNGFSANYFTYPDLLAASGIAEGTPLRNLFTSLKTSDFEAVVRALEDAVVVERAYGHNDHADELEQHAEEVRQALVHAVNTVHPSHRDEAAFDYSSSAVFLDHFKSVFSLNYDLLLYWAILEESRLADGFGLGRETSGGHFRKPFKEDAHCDVFYLHGALHLFQDDDGSVMKALKTSEGVIATITDMITQKKRLPLYVAEASSKAKMKKINSVAYLRHSYEKLRSNTSPIFVFGHSADENDSHIYHAIFSSGAKHVYFGVYRPDDNKIRSHDAQMAKYKTFGGKDIQYSFYDTETAHVWDAGLTAKAPHA